MELSSVKKAMNDARKGILTWTFSFLFLSLLQREKAASSSDDAFCRVPVSTPEEKLAD